MTTDPDRVARGRASRRKGHDAERDLARYLRQWWAWLSVSDVAGLLGGLGVVPRNIRPGVLTAPVRTELRHVVALLVAAGYANATPERSEGPNTPDPHNHPRKA